MTRSALVGLTVLFFYRCAAAQAPSTASSSDDFSPGVEQVAESTGLLPLYIRYKELLARTDRDRFEVLSLRQDILEQVISASLQVDATVARIDSEIALANEYRNALSDKRDREQNMINLAGIATGGTLGVVSSALQLSVNHARAGNSVGIVAGALTAGLSAMGVHAQNGRPKILEFHSNMLANMFERPADPNNIYTPAVIAFLNATAASDPDRLTRKERLIRTWVEVGRIDPVNTPKGQTKIDHVTSTTGRQYKETIDDLDDRRAMLEDVRAKLSLMKRDLGYFLTLLPKTNEAPLRINRLQVNH